MSTTTEPRLVTANRRGVEADLTAPLPSALSKLVRERADQHRKVASKLAALREQVVSLARELAQQERTDEERAAAAIAEGRTPARRQKAASLRNALDEAEAEVTAFESALRKSAQGLFAEAVPHVPEAIDKAQAEHERALVRAHDLAAAFDQALADADAAAAERVWLNAVAAGSQVAPFREGGSGMGDIARLRGALRNAVAEFDQRRAKQQADRERIEAHEAEHAPQWAAREAQARREAEASKVVTEGMRVVSVGGRAVRKGGFGHEPVEDDEGGS